MNKLDEATNKTKAALNTWLEIVRRTLSKVETITESPCAWEVKLGETSRAWANEKEAWAAFLEARSAENDIRNKGDA